MVTWTEILLWRGRNVKRRNLEDTGTLIYWYNEFYGTLLSSEYPYRKILRVIELLRIKTKEVLTRENGWKTQNRNTSYHSKDHMCIRKINHVTN